MNIIDERDKRTIYRKLKKKQYDELMTLSTEEGNWVRLLDEGMVTYAGGEPWFYIVRGTLRKFYESLPNDYVGSINIGHTDLATFPERIVGSWTKDDLRLVDVGDGREALDVRLRLIEDHPLVKALRLMPFELGVSAEFYTNVNEAMTNNESLNPFKVPVVDAVNITDFAIVGDAGNVNSMGIRLKGEKMEITQLTELLSEEGKSIEDVTALLEGLDVAKEPEATEPEAKEPETEEAATEPEAAEPENEIEATEIAEAAEEAEEATEEVEALPNLEQIAAQVEALQSEVETLRAENEDLRTRLAAAESVVEQQKETLAAKDASWDKFRTVFKKLAVVPTDTKETVAKKVQYTDGIGE